MDRAVWLQETENSLRLEFQQISTETAELSLLPSGNNRLEILFAPLTGVSYRKSDSFVVVLVDIFITALRPRHTTT